MTESDFMASGSSAATPARSLKELLRPLENSQGVGPQESDVTLDDQIARFSENDEIPEL